MKIVVSWWLVWLILTAATTLLFGFDLYQSQRAFSLHLWAWGIVYLGIALLLLWLLVNYSWRLRPWAQDKQQIIQP